MNCCRTLKSPNFDLHRLSWGNQADAVTPTQVAAVRKRYGAGEPWSEAVLSKVFLSTKKGEKSASRHKSRMEYNLESPLEKRLTLLATLILIGGGSMGALAFETRVGNPAPLFGVSVLLVAVAMALLYARSLFEDRLRLDADSLVVVRRHGESLRELSHWKRSEVCEASLSKLSTTPSTTPVPPP